MSHALDGSAARAGWRERTGASEADRPAAGVEPWPRLRTEALGLADAVRLVAGVAELVDDAIVIVDPDGGLRERNAAMRQLLERAPAAATLEARLDDVAIRVSGLRFCAPQTRRPRTERVDSGGVAYDVRGTWLPVRGGAATGLCVLHLRRQHDGSMDALAQRCRLTRQQVRVARLLGGGSSNDEIASALFVSPHTVRHHIEQIVHKLGARTRVRAVAIVGRHLGGSE